MIDKFQDFAAIATVTCIVAAIASGNTFLGLSLTTEVLLALLIVLSRWIIPWILE